MKITSSDDIRFKPSLATPEGVPNVSGVKLLDSRINGYELHLLELTID
jgi:hypothetical protein